MDTTYENVKENTSPEKKYVYNNKTLIMYACMYVHEIHLKR